jgi:NTE family protein
VLLFRIPRSAFRVGWCAVRVVAVFGGGGAKALAHVGAWRALTEAGLRPEAVVGTSMGAVIGAALAAGRSHESLEEQAAELVRAHFTIPNPAAVVAGLLVDGLFLEAPLRAMVERIVPAERFEDLALPFLSTMVDVASGKLVLCGSHDLSARHPEITDGFPLRLALAASCALPVYFPPVLIFGRQYAEGGLRAVLPIEAARLFRPDLVVAVHVGPGFDDIRSPEGGNVPIPPLVRAHGEAMRIMMAEQTDRAIAGWPADGPRLVVVRAVHETEATFAGSSARRYIDAGYESTKRALRETA